VGEAFNFGHETAVSVLEVVQQILRLTGREDLTPIVMSEAQHEIAVQRLECTKARRVLRWRPEDEFTSGLRKTIDWYREWLRSDDSINRPSIYK
jgi:CDP-glucose 4,6-dehydratase